MPIVFEILKILVYVVLWIVYLLAIGHGINKKNLALLLSYMFVWAVLNTLAMEFLSTTEFWSNAFASTVVATAGFAFGMIFLNKKPE